MAAHVIEATEEDVDEIVAIHVASWHQAHGVSFPAERLSLGSDEDQRRSEWMKWFSLSDRPSRGTWVARDGDQIVGFTSVDGAEDDDLDPERVGDLYELYVLPEWWGKGVGRDLLERATTHLVTNEFSEAVLWVLEKNLRARRFYDKHGWSRDGSDEYVDWLQARKLRYRTCLPRRSNC